jgi:hypothetical protein
MYVMIILLFGGLLLGFSGRGSRAAQSRIVLAAALIATFIYYMSTRAM